MVSRPLASGKLDAYQKQQRAPGLSEKYGRGSCAAAAVVLLASSGPPHIAGKPVVVRSTLCGQTGACVAQTGAA